MSAEQHAKILALLSDIPIANTPFSVGDVAQVDEKEVTLSFGYPIAQLKGSLATQVKEKLSAAGIELPLNVEQRIPTIRPGNAAQMVEGVKNIIAVASGKGGVGKSTTCANLALALAHEGARVGVLDADIYGPCQPQMFGLGDKRPEVIGGNHFRPLQAMDVQIVSMGSLVTENTPMVWRGPMVSGALKQLLTQTAWEEVDYLVVDMPPGTGDIQLTLGQSVPVSSAVIVTTPQDIALLDAKKGIEMFRKVNIPVVGVVENMATHVCSNCGHEEAIFGEHGGDRLAEQYQTTLLGRLPLAMDIRKQADGGKPSVAADPDSAVSQEYRKIAIQVAADIWVRSLNTSGPEISIVDD